MKKLQLSAAALGVLALPALAIAQHMDHGPKGPTTRAELQKSLAERFAAIDTNKDGVITRAEFDAHREAAKKAFAEKREARRDERFAAMDTDRNGQVSKAEYDAYHEAAKQKWAERRADGDKARGPRGHFSKMHHRGGDMFALADANKDGKVTLAEFSAKPLEMFDKADTNKDGTVTPEERKAAWEKMRAEWQQKRGAENPRS